MDEKDKVSIVRQTVGHFQLFNKIWIQTCLSGSIFYLSFISF